ncbi:MAG: S9 family peptidase, partial [Burkholderiaceae bacterium]
MSGHRKKSAERFDVEALWALERLGAPSLSPDGAQAVASVTAYSMADNKSASSLWLLSTLGGAPRRLTSAGSPDGRDGQPQWSPRGDQIAFIARREQQGVKDEEAQLYVIAPDGGEARRVGPAGGIATGVEAFKWFPDGKRIALVSWVWPRLRGAAAQAKALKEFKARKQIGESGYVTSEALYRYWDHHIPMGRVPHLLVVDLATGKTRDLFEDSIYELGRAEPDANAFDISPDGRRIVFAFDPAAEKRLDNRNCLAEIELTGGAVRVLLQDRDWDFGAPRYSHAGGHLAFLASHQGLRHTMPCQLGVLDTQGRWAVLSADWDHEVTAPLAWAEDDLSLLFGAEDRGRRHLWRFDLVERQAAIVFEGGNATSFAAGADTIVVNHDSVQHPPRLSVLAGTQAARRIEQFNDARLARRRLSRHEEVFIEGA